MDDDGTTGSIKSFLNKMSSLKKERKAEEEIIDLVNEGHENGAIEASEAAMITNVIEFGDKEAQDIMIHRAQIIALDGDMHFKEAIDFILSANNSRFPVYEESLDHIIGILHLKDAMRIHNRNELLDQPIRKIKGLLRDPFFIPETRNVGDLFKSMQSKKVWLARLRWRPMPSSFELPWKIFWKKSSVIYRMNMIKKNPILKKKETTNTLLTD